MDKMSENTDFNVYTYNLVEPDKKSGSYIHWADGLNMVIKKGDVRIELNSKEIQQIVKSLPRTLGGTYK